MGKFKKGDYVKSCIAGGIKKGIVLKEGCEDNYLIGVIDPANFPGHSKGEDYLSEDDKIRFANRQWWVDDTDLELLSSGDDVSTAPYSDHYKTAIQSIEVMQANMSINEFIGFLRGNVIKYACRMSHKGEPGKDAAKLRQYAEWLEKALKGDKIVVKEDKQ